MSDMQNLAVALPAETLYVSGTVNSIETTWTNTYENYWETTAARSDNDIYFVELTMINAAGTTSYASLTLYYGILNLITWRTQADVDRVLYLSKKGRLNFTTAETEEWDNSLIGAYNASDLNRVGAAIEYVSDKLNTQGITVKVNPKKDWYREQIPTPAQLEKYLTDVKVLRDAFSSAALPPVPSDMDYFTYIEANNIEKILLGIDAIITAMSRMYIRCGTLYCGSATWYFLS